MKKNLYAMHAGLCGFFLFAICSGSQAQFKKGEVLVGGNISFLTQDLSPDDPTLAYALRNTMVNFSPSIGWAIRDNLVEGIDLNFSYSNIRQSIPGGLPSNTTQKEQGYGIGYFIQHYNPLGKGFYLFVGGNLNGNYSQLTYVDNSDGSKIQDDKRYSITVGFNPGLSYSLCKRVQIEAGFPNLLSINYTHFKNDDLDPSGSGKLLLSKDNMFNLSSTVDNALGNMAIGFRFLLGS